MLYLISLGIEEKGISLKAIETAKKCDILYLENYTSFGKPKEELEQTLNKEITSVERDFVESNQLIEQSKNKNIGLLIYGDALSATTHLSLINEASKQRIKYEIIPGISIISLIAETGLSLYKFGKTASIPFNNKEIKSPYEILKQNDSITAHTLFLLDLNPKDNKHLQIKDAIDYLIQNGMDKERLCIACSSLGTEHSVIKGDKAENLVTLKLNPPCCLIVVGELNFFEEEYLKKWMK